MVREAMSATSGMKRENASVIDIRYSANRASDQRMSRESTRALSLDASRSTTVQSWRQKNRAAVNDFPDDVNDYPAEVAAKAHRGEFRLLLLHVLQRTSAL
jgi:hypothetical protein